jgi:Transcriptional regulators containing a DNA-binding HTH domain and an aminotransferase domain (MocR family) and their eukaryotic orthologs
MDSRVSARVLSSALGGWRTREPAYEALADGIRLLCLDNRLAPRTALPAERELAHALSVSRTTVAAAYRSLRESGHISSVRGSGSVTLPLGRRESGAPRVAADDIDLVQASPAAWPGLAGVMSDAAQDVAALVSRAGYDIVGSAALRAAIADRYTQRGLSTTPEQIVVTTGAQSAIHLLATTLLHRGDRAAIETPTYPHAAEALRRAGARLVSIPVTTDDGWDLDRAVQVFARTGPSIAYLMPHFQNPTGRSMTPEEQEVIHAAARSSNSVIVVDETTGELAIDHPVPSALAFPDDRVVRVGSLGKTVWGGLRIGWIRADREIAAEVIAGRSANELGTPEFEQAVAVRLIGEMSAILVQRATLLREGRDALTSALIDRLPRWRVPTVTGGVCLWVELDAPLSSGLVLAARQRGLHLSAGPRFSPDGGHERHLRIPFTAPADQLRRAVEILAAVWPEVRTAAPRGIVEPTEALV